MDRCQLPSKDLVAQEQKPFVDLLQEQDHDEFVIGQFLYNEIFDARIERDKVTEKTADD